MNFEKGDQFNKLQKCYGFQKITYSTLIIDEFYKLNEVQEIGEF